VFGNSFGWHVVNSTSRRTGSTHLYLVACVIMLVPCGHKPSGGRDRQLLA